MSRLTRLRSVGQFVECSGVDFAVVALLSRCCLCLSDPALELVEANHSVCAGGIFTVLMNSGDTASESRCESSGCTDCADELLRLCVHKYSLSVGVGMGHDMKNPCSTSLAGTTGVSYLRDSIFSYSVSIRTGDCPDR